MSSNLGTEKNLRILVIDDNRTIHDDFRKILSPARPGDMLEGAETLLFNAPGHTKRPMFEIDSAYQGKEGLDLVEQAVQKGRPYAVAFVDIRMPPGWDGVETAAKIWEAYPDLQIVICTAYSDYSWDEMSARLKNSDRLVILKKPFDTVEVLQLANALTEKWRLHQEASKKLDQLEKLVQERTKVLQETNERYQLLFSKNPLPMFVVDSKTLAFLAVNETAVREYGYSFEEFLSRTVNDLHLAEDIPLLLKRFSETAHPPFSYAVTQHRKKDGSIVDVEIIARMVTFDGREANLALANNITERKRSEDRIREQATLLDLAADGIFVRDLEGHIQFWNKGAECLYGWTPGEAVGKKVGELFPHDDLVLFEAAEKVVLEKGDWSGEFHRHTKAGEEVIVSSRWTLLRDATGQPKSILAINTDITEKKRLENQFLRAQRMEGIGTLATGMAHDLNNILSPILMSAGTLRWKLTPAEHDLAITRIEMSVKRAADIIQQVLTFGRGVSGERAAVNPAVLLEEVLKIVGQTFPKDIAISLDAEPGLWPIIGDKTQIHQVLLNLCINSRDAMSEVGGLSLLAQNVMLDKRSASAQQQARPGPYVMLQVTDTGQGIPASNLEKIFDPFFTTKEIGKGTGLGLSTVLGIVKSHQGFITVDSEVKKGTTFKVFLPASPEAGNHSKSRTATSLPHGKGEAILFVDDEDSIVSSNRRMLENYGYKVLTAKNGEEALSIFRRNGQIVHVVVTDILMPDMDGVELIREVKKIHPKIKIIASSGLGKDLNGRFQVSDLKSLKIDNFLDKPYTVQQLLTVLHEILSGKQGTTSLMRKAKRADGAPATLKK